MSRASRPRQPVNAYIQFMGAVRNRIRQENPHMSNPEILSTMAEMWQEMPDHERIEYEALAQADRERYQRELAEYERRQPELERDRENDRDRDIHRYVLNPETGRYVRTGYTDDVYTDDDYIENPRTGRNVLRTSSLGQRIEEGRLSPTPWFSMPPPPPPPPPPTYDENPHAYILNPLTGTQVLRTSHVGRQILAEEEPRSSQSEHSLSPRTLRKFENYQCFELSADSDEVCAICLNNYSAGDVICTHANGKHSMHKTCLLTWFNTNRNTCPVCKQRFGSRRKRRKSLRRHKYRRSKKRSKKRMLGI